MAASSAAALSLGTPEGVAVLGRPLNLVFAVRTDGGPVADACISAQITAGDTPVSPGQVRVSPTTTSAGPGTGIRVQTTQPVSEPVLSVRLSAGCSGSVVRIYSVLAYPAEALAPRQLVAATAAAVPERPTASIAAQAAPGAASKDASRGAPGKTAKPVQTGQRPKRSKTATQLAAAPGVAAEAGRPRLVMEPLSDWLEAPSVLRASPEIATLSPATPQLREEAAARWRALNMQPQEMLEEAARLVAQEGELARQRAQAEREKALALEVQQKLEQRVAERFSATVVYGLVALLLLLAGVLLWLWSRTRRTRTTVQTSWTQAATSHRDAPVSAPRPQVPAQAATAPYVDHSLRPQSTEPELLPSGVMPLEFGLAQADAKGQSEQTGQGAFAATSAAAPVTAVVNPEDLFDLQQQAEFFVSVGEHDQAIDVMKQHIEANQSSSPLAYLELLRLYRSLSRIEQFNALRAQFHQHFNAQVPEFSAFSRQGKTLFAYPEVLARIEALWCDPSVVPLLQELLFRNSAQDDQRFDLPAYDDLLLLHAVARTTPASARGITSPRARTTPLEPEAFEPPQAELMDPSHEAASNLMEFEPDWEFEAPKAATGDAESNDPSALDLDLSDLTHLDALSEQAGASAPLPFLTEEEQPSVPGSAPPAPHQPVGFGSNSDRFEARVDPELRKPL